MKWPSGTKDTNRVIVNFLRYELEDLEMKPDQEPLLVEQIHAAAFKHNTLGLPKICPEENVGKISRQTLYTYLKAFHRQEKRTFLTSSILQLNDPNIFMKSTGLRGWLWLAWV